MRAAMEDVHIEADLENYIAAVVHHTRREQRTAVGASPRGSLALLKLARAKAALDGRAYVLPDDVKTFIQPALSHRLVLKPDLWMNKTAAYEVLDTIANLVPVPVIE